MEEIKPTIVSVPKPIPTLQQAQKEQKDNAIASRWTMLLFMIVSVVLAIAGNMISVPMAAVAILVYIKGRTEIQ